MLPNEDHELKDFNSYNSVKSTMKLLRMLRCKQIFPRIYSQSCTGCIFVFTEAIFTQNFFNFRNSSLVNYMEDKFNKDDRSQQWSCYIAFVPGPPWSQSSRQKNEHNSGVTSSSWRTEHVFIENSYTGIVYETKFV